MSRIQQARNFTGFVGCTSDELFSPTSDAEKILGQLNYGQAFAYLFRRFGYPTYGCDPYKHLVEYYLTTPMNGVVLTVAPHNCSFGYLVTKEISQLCYEEVRKPLVEWKSRFLEWAKQTLGETVFTVWDWEGTPEQISVLNHWLDINHPQVTTVERFTPELRQCFWQAMSSKFDTFAQQYSQIDPQPVRNLTITPGSLRAKVLAALRTTIADLKRPVSIRDWYINIIGKVPYTEVQSPVEPSFMAGYGVYTEVYQQPELYFDLMESLKTAGDGSIVKGMALLKEKLKGISMSCATANNQLSKS